MLNTFKVLEIKMKIIVPATSANIGPGFDSVGVALSKYLEIEVLEESQEWVIEHDLNPRIPKDRRNLLVKIACSWLQIFSRVV